MRQEAKYSDSSNYLNNMSCRPRTQVNTGSLPMTLLPESFKGREITVDLSSCIPNNLQKWIKNNSYGRATQTSALNALINMGYNRQIRTYIKFIESSDNHEQEILNKLTEKTDLIDGLPDIGIIIDRKKPDRNPVELSLQSVLYFMAHTSGRIYLKNKSPLLSSIYQLIAGETTEEDSYFFRKAVTVKFIGGLKQ